MACGLVPIADISTAAAIAKSQQHEEAAAIFSGSQMQALDALTKSGFEEVKEGISFSFCRATHA